MNYLVDECFQAEVEKTNWFWDRGRPRWRAPTGKLEGMQHFVWKLSGRTVPAAPLTIDHINRDPTDNRISNLRVATPRLQALNTLKRTRRGLPRGVHIVKSQTRPYQARVSVRGKSQHLGVFATAGEASAAYEAELARQIATEASLTPSEEKNV
jgi:hypothetical protein